MRTTRTTTRPPPLSLPRPHPQRNEDEDATTTTLQRRGRVVLTDLVCPSATAMTPRPCLVPPCATTTMRPPPRPHRDLAHHSHTGRTTTASRLVPPHATTTTTSSVPPHVTTTVPCPRAVLTHCATRTRTVHAIPTPTPSRLNLTMSVHAYVCSCSACSRHPHHPRRLVAPLPSLVALSCRHHPSSAVTVPRHLVIPSPPLIASLRRRHPSSPGHTVAVPRRPQLATHQRCFIEFVASTLELIVHVTMRSEVEAPYTYIHVKIFM